MILTPRGSARNKTCNKNRNQNVHENVQERKNMEGVQENIQQPEHNTIVNIEGVRFGDGENEGKVTLTTKEASGEHAGTIIQFTMPIRNKDGFMSPPMKIYQCLNAGHGKDWVHKFSTIEEAIQALRGKYLAGTSVAKEKGGVGNNLKDGTIKDVPEDFEPAA
jgi:hypothetical protein